MRSITTLVLILAGSILVSAQVLPPISTFTPEEYDAGTQNWSVTQDERGFVYAANNQGLLEYDGERWALTPSPNGSIVRSTRAIGDRIYVGSYMDFGYYSVPGTRGSAQTDTVARPSGTYVSLAAKIKDSIRPDEQFWKIELVDGIILFQSLSQLYLYNPVTDSLSVTAMGTGLTKLFVVRDAVYYQDDQQRLYRLATDGKPEAVTTTGDHYIFVNLWEAASKLYGQTVSSGAVVLENQRWQPTALFPFLSGETLYSALNLRGGGKVFGTISSGLYVTDDDNRLRYHIDHIGGLANNTVLSLFEDRAGNLWAGTDNGISVINLRSPIRKYTDVSGKIGTVHASALYGERLYLGTNQGLFTQPADGRAPPELVPGTRGQVWSLFEYEGVLFCGHDRGTMIVTAANAQVITGTLGTWGFATVPNRPDLLLQGGYAGLSVLERSVGGAWSLRNNVAGFSYSARFLTLNDRLEVLVSHEYRGVYGLRLADDLREVTEQKLFDRPGKSPNAGLATFAGEVYFYSAEGVFRYLDFDAGFTRDEALSAILGAADYSSGKMVADGKRLWFFNNKGLTYLYQASLGQVVKHRQVPLTRKLLNAKLGYENLSDLTDGRLLLGTADGYLTLRLDDLGDERHELTLRSVRTQPADAPGRQLTKLVDPTLSHTEHNVRFDLAVPRYSEYLGARYRYRLLGADAEDWSAWALEPTINLTEVPPGAYVFEAQSRVGDRVSENTVSYPFSVRRPWYASGLAWSAYVLLGSLALLVAYQLNRRHYLKKQTELKLENERRIKEQQQASELALTRLNNDRLREDVASKSREMASTMMSLVKKNELLQEIKSQLERKEDPERKVRAVVRTIDQNLDEAETWSIFRDAFENADREFFKTIKEHHPALTPSDLKLCAYLRLNLTTKEIASMLNISPRSAEVKRYRLRKKMGLARETGLADYIMSL